MVHLPDERLRICLSDIELGGWNVAAEESDVREVDVVRVLA